MADHASFLRHVYRGVADVAGRQGPALAELVDASAIL